MGYDRGKLEALRRKYAGALEQLHPERQLQCLDLVADGAMRDVEFARRLGQRGMAGRSFESAKGIQRRQAFGHGQLPQVCEIFSQTRA